MARKSVAALGGCDPWPRRPGRLMTDMLSVPAFQFGNPGTLFVLSKAHNSALHMGPLNYRSHLH
jgi:hypothetical protein